MALKACKDCGGVVSPSASACPRCGAKLRDGYWDRHRKRTRRALWVMAGIVVVAFVVGVTGG